MSLLCSKINKINSLIRKELVKSINQVSNIKAQEDLIINNLSFSITLNLLQSLNFNPNNFSNLYSLGDYHPEYNGVVVNNDIITTSFYHKLEDNLITQLDNQTNKNYLFKSLDFLINSKASFSKIEKVISMISQYHNLHKHKETQELLKLLNNYSYYNSLGKELTIKAKKNTNTYINLDSKELNNLKIQPYMTKNKSQKKNDIYEYLGLESINNIKLIDKNNINNNVLSKKNQISLLQTYTNKVDDYLNRYKNEDISYDIENDVIMLKFKNNKTIIFVELLDLTNNGLSLYQSIINNIKPNIVLINNEPLEYCIKNNSQNIKNSVKSVSIFKQKEDIMNIIETKGDIYKYKSFNNEVYYNTEGSIKNLAIVESIIYHAVKNNIQVELFDLPIQLFAASFAQCLIDKNKSTNNEYLSNLLSITKLMNLSSLYTWSEYQSLNGCFKCASFLNKNTVPIEPYSLEFSFDKKQLPNYKYIKAYRINKLIQAYKLNESVVVFSNFINEDIKYFVHALNNLDIENAYLQDCSNLNRIINKTKVDSKNNRSLYTSINKNEERISFYALSMIFKQHPLKYLLYENNYSSLINLIHSNKDITTFNKSLYNYFCYINLMKSGIKKSNDNITNNYNRSINDLLEDIYIGKNNECAIENYFSFIKSLKI